MKVAVAYNNGEIAENFGSCNIFASYNYTGEYVNECDKTLLECAPMSDPSAVAELLLENAVEAVICGNISPDAKNILLVKGVIPVSGFCGDADTAADMLVTGQLPIYDGSESGGCSGCCSGCGGGCGSGDEGSCGCGDGCGCGEHEH